MIVAIHQPHYLPWQGYFDKIDMADVFVLLDCVQYEKGGWQNRNKIKTASGSHWLTVPVKKNGCFQLLEDVEIDESSQWRKKHLLTFQTYYAKAEHYHEIRGVLEIILSLAMDLNPFNNIGISMLARKLGIETRIVDAHEITGLSDDPNRRLVDIVRAVGGDTYLCGAGASQYFDERPFQEAGIRVIQQDFRPQVYKQLHGDFIPNLSVVDAMMNIGGRATLGLIRKGRFTTL